MRWNKTNCVLPVVTGSSANRFRCRRTENYCTMSIGLEIDTDIKLERSVMKKLDSSRYTRYFNTLEHKKIIHEWDLFL